MTGPSFTQQRSTGLSFNCEFCGQSTENQEAILSIIILKSEQSLTQMFPNKLLTPALLRLLIPFLCIDILSETNFFFWLLIVGPVGPWLVELSVCRLTHNYFLQQNILGLSVRKADTHGGVLWKKTGKRWVKPKDTRRLLPQCFCNLLCPCNS